MSSQTKHTPGPWFVADKKLTGGAIIVSHGNPVGGGDSIADVDPCGPWVSEETAEADARLIAAAPELLAAAQSAVALLLAYHKEFEADDYDPTWLKLDAAIAKATNP